MKETGFFLASDIHLRSKDCRAKPFLSGLEKHSPGKKIVIVGDLFSQEGVMTEDQLEVGRYLLHNRHRVVYVNGNHDDHLTEMFGIKAFKKYEWKIAGKKYCAIHGHQFHQFCFVFNEQLIDDAFSHFIWLLKEINVAGFSLSRWFDNYHQKFSERILHRAKKYAHRHRIDVLVYGHTHIPLHVKLEEKGRIIECINCGSWVTDNCSFVTIENDGRAQLHMVTP